MIGAFPRDIDGLADFCSLAEGLDATAVASKLDVESTLCLMATDIIVVAEQVASSWRSRLNKAQKVYLTLREIGKPAHYSVVYERYNRLFFEDDPTENSIHAILGREEYGVVWIGVRGTYALREWGYERPSKGLFEAVAEIVDKRYRETGRPVPMLVIEAEIGRYRSLVKPASLTIAAHCNPALQHTSKDSFVPRVPDAEDEVELAADELDRILQDFEKRKGTR
jgi:hypothetical protein